MVKKEVALRFHLRLWLLSGGEDKAEAVYSPAPGSVEQLRVEAANVEQYKHIKNPKKVEDHNQYEMYVKK
jgi:hypothetical protein